ncbi:hypothetical protein AArcCO_1355 [Halalkaliarchaeum sp. AArc-CO]|nr:hypothetical protein AArcCO_1355 [Halalkaliarchaeum sp. AArc-CO]
MTSDQAQSLGVGEDQFLVLFGELLAPVLGDLIENLLFFWRAGRLVLAHGARYVLGADKDGVGMGQSGPRDPRSRLKVQTISLRVVPSTVVPRPHPELRLRVQRG